MVVAIELEPTTLTMSNLLRNRDISLNYKKMLNLISYKISQK